MNIFMARWSTNRLAEDFASNQENRDALLQLHWDLIVALEEYCEIDEGLWARAMEESRRSADRLATTETMLSVGSAALFVIILTYGFFVHRTLDDQNREQQVLQCAIGATHDGVLIIRYDTLEIEYANTGAAEQFGRTREELCRRSLEYVLANFDAGDFRSFMSPLVEGEVGSLLFETRHLGPDSGSCDAEVMIQQVPGGDGVRRFMLVMRDITSKKRAEAHFRAIVEGTTATGEEFFEQLASSLSAALGVNQVFIGELIGENVVNAHMLFDRGVFEKVPEYPLAGSPCEDVVGSCQPLYETQRLQQLYSENAYIADNGVTTYLGVPLRNSKGDCVGLLAALHDGPIESELDPLETMELFAARVTSEIERMRNEAVFHSIVRGTTARGEQFFEELSHALKDALSVNQVYIGETRDSGESVCVHVMNDRGTCQRIDTFNLCGAPCQEVIRSGSPRVIEHDLQALYPELDVLREMNAHSYMSVPLIDERGECIGMLSVLNDGPIESGLDPLETMEMFASRVVTELKQMRAHERFRDVVRGTSTTGSEFFENFTASLSKSLEVNQVVIAECDGDSHFVACAFYDRGDIHTEVGYERAGTPCDIVCRTKNQFSQQDGLQARFPKDVMLQDIDAHSYIGSPLLSSNGEVIGVMAVMHDRPIQSELDPHEMVELFASRAAAELDRLRSETKLRESENRLELAMRAANVGFWDYDIQNNSTDFSELWYASLGYKHGELQNTLEARVELTHPDDAARATLAFEAHLRGETEMFRTEHRIRHKNGTYRWTLDIGRVVERDADGNATRMAGVYVDVDTLKQHELELERARAQLAESQERLDLALNAASIGLWDTDLVSGEAFLSDIWYTMLGYEPGAFSPTLDSWIELLHPDDRQRGFEEFDRHIAGETELFRTESRARTASGEYKWIQDIGRIQEWNEDGTPRRMIGVHLDIDTRRRHEDELDEARRNAEVASQTKSEFLANMSHEIRTPMTAILGYTDLLLGENIDTHERHEYVTTIQDNGKHLLQIINDILDISKIDSGKMVIETIESDLTEIVDGIQTLFAGPMDEKGLGYEIVFASPIPRRVCTDPMRVRQILINLIGNSLKFTDTGCVKVRLGMESHNSSVLLVEVEDSGIGMDKSSIKTLFDPFTQADSSTTRRFGGTGLGLAITRRLVELLGGTIDVESEPGSGTCFRLAIPVAPIEGSEMIATVRDMSEAPSVDPGESGACLSNVSGACRILLAEDGVDNQRLIETFLVSSGAHVCIVENGQEAVDELTRNPGGFDIVLMDMQMPVMDGYEATRRIDGMGLGVPVLALTAHAMRGDRERCIAAGCIDYLTKPINKDTLVSTCARYWDRRANRAA
ncbi:MAG: PAS domain-containing protein [Planctomycetota bacterium]